MSGILWVGVPHGDESPRFYSNPHIWVVPGDDPYGTPGDPRAGANSYIWARVHNSDEGRAAIGAVVEFYFHSFSTSLSINSLLRVGVARVDLPPQAIDEVLCVVPFRPSTGGHGCLVVVIRHPLDPLPANWGDSLWGQGRRDSQVGQRNITVLAGNAGVVHATPFEVGPLRSDSTRVTLEVRRIGVAESEARQLLESVGVRASTPPLVSVARVGLSATREGAVGWWTSNTMALDLPRGHSRYMFLLTEILPGPPGFEIIDVVAIADGRPSGGISAVVVREVK